MKTKAISYVRFSTKEQSKGDSYRRQSEATAEYCARKGITLLEDEYFDSGISAFKGKNEDEGALSEIIDRSKRGIYPKGTILIVESLDRISRQEINRALRLFLEILENGLDIVTLSDGERHYRHDKTELVDLIVSLVVLSRAHEESVMKSQRVSAAWAGKRIKAKKGEIITRICPAWMEVIDGKFQLIPDRVKIVKEIFRMSNEENLGSHAITTILNERNIAPWETLKNNKTGVWSKTYVTKILNNVAVMGIHQPRKRVEGKLIDVGEPIPDYYPAIIDKETFNRHKTKSNNRKKFKVGRPSGENDWNLFKGLVKCSNCGNALHFVSKASKGKTYRYLFCSGKCGAVTSRYEDFERMVLRALPTVDYKAINNANREIITRNEAREGQIITKKEELKKLKERWKKTNSETILEMISETELEITNIQKEMEEVQSIQDPKSTAERLQYIEKRLLEDDQTWRNGFRTTVTKLIKEITLDTATSNSEILFFNGPKVTGSFKDGKISLIKKTV